MKFREGNVVECVAKVKTNDRELAKGTIIWIIEDDYFVLDTEGYLHKVMFNEAWEIQE